MDRHTHPGLSACGEHRAKVVDTGGPDQPRVISHPLGRGVALPPMARRPLGRYAGAVSPARRQVRIVVSSLGIVVIVLAAIFGSPGTVEGIGYVVVVAVLALLIQRERRGLKG